MSMVPSHYFINVSHKGSYLFSTEPLLINCVERHKTVFELFKNKFPAKEGYKVTLTRVDCVGTIIE